MCWGAQAAGVSGAAARRAETRRSRAGCLRSRASVSVGRAADRGTRAACSPLLPPENRPGRRAVAVANFHRQTNEVVAPGLHLRQVQSLNDPDPGAEQNLMTLDAVALVAADGEV